MADTRTTTPNRPPPLALALAALSMAVLLVVMGVPRLVAALYVLDASSVVQAVAGGQQVPDAALADALRSLDAAAGWQADARTEAARGMLLTARAASVPAGGRGQWQAQAEQAFTRSLTLSPAQAETWFRLAWLRDATGNRPGAAEALRLSFLAGAFAPELMLPRLKLGLRLLPILDAADRDVLKREIRLTWIANPDVLVALSSSGAGGELVGEALAGLTEEDMARYIAARNAK